MELEKKILFFRCSTFNPRISESTTARWTMAERRQHRSSIWRKPVSLISDYSQLCYILRITYTVTVASSFCSQLIVYCIIIIFSDPPEELKVTLETVKKHAIMWRIETNANDKLPVLRIEIQAIRNEILEDEVSIQLPRTINRDVFTSWELLCVISCILSWTGNGSEISEVI